jgi:phage FluMu protein Com
MNKLQELKDKPIQCLKCDTIFSLKDGDEVTYFTNDDNRFNVFCPSCKQLVDFVLVSLSK